MASKAEHEQKFLSNIAVLTNANIHLHSCYDWQVIVAFYSVVQLANAHIAHQWSLSFLNHKSVMKHLDPADPFVQKNPVLGEDTYAAYAYLYNRSREARYLNAVTDEGHASNSLPAVTHIKFKVLKRSIEHLDRACCEYNALYPELAIPQSEIYLNGKLSASCKHFVDVGSLEA